MPCHDITRGVFLPLCSIPFSLAINPNPTSKNISLFRTTSFSLLHLGQESDTIYPLTMWIPHRPSKPLKSYSNRDASVMTSTTPSERKDVEGHDRRKVSEENLRPKTEKRRSAPEGEMWRGRCKRGKRETREEYWEDGRAAATLYYIDFWHASMMLGSIIAARSKHAKPEEATSIGGGWAFGNAANFTVRWLYFQLVDVLKPL
ncbi:hypothetical protein GX48_04874 [Paracoccidioides brasiliensis]|nr:hypothetical protein GX48_04874 [Paracoccidioides brasiliensis]